MRGPQLAPYLTPALSRCEDAAVETLGELLADYHSGLAAQFREVPIPGALSYALGLQVGGGGGRDEPLVPQIPLGRTAILAGPDVLRFDAVDALRSFAVASGVGVANTWGAKGVLRWDDPLHLGTCGLQADDFALLGFGDLDALWVTGIDHAESPNAHLAICRHIEIIDPRDLEALTPKISRSVQPIETPPLFHRLAAIAQPGYIDDRFPRHPCRAVMDLKQSLPSDALVVGDPGPAGFWLARTFPTDRPGSIVVPATNLDGIGCAVALAAATNGIPTTFVTVEPIDGLITEVEAIAESKGLPFSVEVWGDDVDLSLTSLLIEAAGSVVAWTP